MWFLLLRSVFTAKAQDAYASMPVASCLDHDEVKCTVLCTYELVQEAY